MKSWQTLRIALLLALIFAGGFFAGRTSAPRPPASFMAVNGRAFTAQDLLNHMAMEFGLDATQKDQFRPILEETVQKMGQLAPGEPQRVEIYRACTARLRELIRPDQREHFDQQVERTVRIFQRAQNRALPGKGVRREKDPSERQP